METGDRERLAFVDALRGLAFVFMLLNHSATYLLDASLDPARIYLIYATVTLAAPLFLFLTGFSMALSHAARPENPKRFAAYLRTGLLLIAIGLALNPICAPGKPLLAGGILQTIGVGTILLGPSVRWMTKGRTRNGMLLAAGAAYVAFAHSYRSAVASVSDFPTVQHLLFDGFPPWPWISLIVLGLAVGFQWVERGRSRSTLIRSLGAMASSCLFLHVLVGVAEGNLSRIDFGHDFIINNHWMPGPVTALWLVAALLGNFLLMHFAATRMAWRMNWLREIGRQALLLYVLHLLLIRGLGVRVLDLHLDSWWQFSAVNLALTATMIFAASVASKWAATVFSQRAWV